MILTVWGRVGLVLVLVLVLGVGLVLASVLVLGLLLLVWAAQPCGFVTVA